MTRHSRNCTAGTVYTYHERQKDQHQSGYGSKQVRIGKDSVKVSTFVIIIVSCWGPRIFINLTLKTPRKPASETVICLCRLLNILANFSNPFLHTGKQCGPRSDCS